MNLANPTALLWAALAVPIVIFYILKIRMRRVPVSTVMFWEHVFEDKQPRSIWETLRHLLSLLLQLAFLALLVFALAEPFFDWEILEQRRVIVVLDNSASMSATDVEPTRLDAAKAEAGRLITALKPRDEMAVITAGTQPRVACGLTSHQRTLQNAVDAARATDGPTRIAEAVELARRLLGNHERGQVVVLTDGCFEAAAELAAAEDVVWSSFGSAESANVGITRFQVRRSLLDPIGYEVLAEVSNFSDQPAECRLELELGTEIVDVIPLTLEPNDTWSEVFEKTSAAGGPLRARIDSEDVFAADNVAYAILPERPRIPVTLVTEGNLFLERVLQANALVDLTVSSTIPEQPAENGILILHQKTGAVVPPGRVFVIQPQGATDLWEVGEKIENPIVAEQDQDSDLLLHVRLDNVLMPEALELRPTGAHHALVESAEESPIYFSVARESGKVLVLSVNLDRGDLPLRTAFPIMMTNALAWFSDDKGELREALSTGAVADVDLPAGLQRAGAGAAAGAGTGTGAAAGELVLTAPDARELPIPPGESATIGPLDQAGIWRIHRPRDAANGSDVQLEIACNVTNAVESDLRRDSGVAPRQEVITAGFGGRPVWFVLIVLAWLLMSIEWYLYQRRWIS